MTEQELVDGALQARYDAMVGLATHALTLLAALSAVGVQEDDYEEHVLYCVLCRGHFDVPYAANGYIVNPNDVAHSPECELVKAKRLLDSPEARRLLGAFPAPAFAPAPLHTDKGA